MEFIYLGKKYRGEIISILNEDLKKWGIRSKAYLELEVDGEKSLFPLEGIKNIIKIK